MKKITVLLLAVVALVTACVSPSLYPFYTEKDVVTDVRLVGTWRRDKEYNKEVNDAKVETWKFEYTTNKTYVVTIINVFDEEKIADKPALSEPALFECRLFKIRQELFIDLTPVEDGSSSSTALSMIPGHLLFRVKFEDQKIKMAFFSPEDYIKKHPSALKHRLVNGRVFITSETRALQMFVMKHLDTIEAFSDGCFSDWMEYKRL